jgi:adenosylmethionine-8-amino-7-oxononanoate aminotransferase
MFILNSLPINKHFRKLFYRFVLRHYIEVMNNNHTWLDEGLQHIWLPYTQMQNVLNGNKQNNEATTPLPVKTAYGSTIELYDGRKLLDGICNWWSSAHGFQHPHIVECMQKQLAELSHIMFAGLAHEPAYKLATRLCKVAPEGIEKVFFADSGSNAVEIAMKMAVQYFANNGNKRKNKFVSFKNGYHGESMGALSLGDPDGWTAKTFNNYMPRQFCLELPHDEYSFAEFEDVLKTHASSIAALVIEPLVQGAGGFKFHSPDVLAEIYRITKKHNILFIADEIMTGFWRTGSPFACMEAGITPDIMCIGKALTGGMVSLAATLTTKQIFDAFLNDSFGSDNFQKAFLHGPTFMANPLACSAANASLDLFEAENFFDKVEKIESILQSNLLPLQAHQKVIDVRVKGALGVVQLNIPQNNDDKSNNAAWAEILQIRKKLLAQNVWLRPFKDVIYIMPNFNITEAELTTLCDAVKFVLE